MYLLSLCPSRSVRLAQSPGDQTVTSWWISGKQKLRIPYVQTSLRPWFWLLTRMFPGVPCSSSCQHCRSWQLFPLVAYRKVTTSAEVSTWLSTHRVLSHWLRIQCAILDTPDTLTTSFGLATNYIQLIDNSFPPGLHVLSCSSCSYDP